MDVQDLITLVADLPEAVQENAMNLLERMGSTIEGIGDTDIQWKPPILKVVQATTDRSTLPKGTSIGDIVIGDTKMEQPLKVIPIRTWDSRQMWDPNKDNTRVLCWSPDATTGAQGQACKTCVHSKFDEVNNRVDCTKNKTFLVISADLSEIFQVNFAKTNYQNGMEWTTLLKKAGVAPYRRVYELHAETSKKYKNVEALLAEPVGLQEGGVVPQEYLKFLEALFNRVSEDRKDHIQVFLEQAQRRALQLGGPGESSAEEPAGYIEAKADKASSEQSESASKYAL